MFVYILLEVILPILILIIVGALIQIKFTFDLKQLSTLITYCLMPAAVFINIIDIKVNTTVMMHIISYLIIYTVILMLLGNGLSKLLKLDKPQGAALKNSISLMNSGNYGMPVSQLVFAHNPIGVSIQIFILIFQNLLTYSYGLYNLLSATTTLRGIITSLLRLPIFHALILGIIFQVFHIPLPEFVHIPLNELSDAFVAIALLLLGAQLAKIRLRFLHLVITWSLIGRLIIGPLLSLAIIYILKIDGVVAQSLFVASSFPTSRNTSTIAMEYDVEPELHAQVVLYSTLLSVITVTTVIYLSRIMF
jgi:predicted permease